MFSGPPAKVIPPVTVDDAPLDLAIPTSVGATEVTVISLEAEDEMPASPFELEEAQAEDINFIHSRGPARILQTAGAVEGGEEPQIAPG